MTKGKVRDDRVEQLLAAVNRDGSVELLEVRENVAICLAIWSADMQLHPDCYPTTTPELVHNLLARHAPQIKNLRLKFGLEQLPPRIPPNGSDEGGDD